MRSKEEIPPQAGGEALDRLSRAAVDAPSLGRSFQPCLPILLLQMSGALAEPVSKSFLPVFSGRLRAPVPARSGADIHFSSEGEQDPSHPGGFGRSHPEPVRWQLDGECPGRAQGRRSVARGALPCRAVDLVRGRCPRRCRDSAAQARALRSCHSFPRWAGAGMKVWHRPAAP